MLEENRPNYNLELLNFSKSIFHSASLENICIISVQHLLGTVSEMFTSWLDLGLKAENIHVLGKCYSSNKEVIEEMEAKGIQVSPYSSAYHSHIAYDDIFDELVRGFLKSRLDRCSSFERIILLDDGGHLIDIATEICGDEANRIVGVEQTTSGYEKLKNRRLKFPVINVAKSEVKSKYEPDWVSRVIIDKTFEKLSKEPERILIAGRGTIGSSIHSILSNKYDVQFWDIKNPTFPIDNILQRADLIFGCTGNVSITHNKHRFLKQGCVLSSGSSSDREFDSVHLRRQFPASRDCHADFDNGQFTLLNSGFPVNFTGGAHSVPPEQIRLIRALITIGTLQAAGLTSGAEGIIELDKTHQNTLIKKWEEIQNRPHLDKQRLLDPYAT